MVYIVSSFIQREGVDPTLPYLCTLASEMLGNSIRVSTFITGIIINNIEALIAKEHGATLEEIYNELIVRSLELGFLDILSKEHSDLTPLLNDYFDYHSDTEEYHIKKNTKFKKYILDHVHFTQAHARGYECKG